MKKWCRVHTGWKTLCCPSVWQLRHSYFVDFYVFKPAQTSCWWKSKILGERKSEVYLKVIYFSCWVVGWRGSDRCRLVVYGAWLSAGRAAFLSGSWFSVLGRCSKLEANLSISYSPSTFTALSNFLPLSLSPFFPQSLFSPHLPPTLSFSFPIHPFLFYNSAHWSQKSKKCTQNLLPIAPSLPFLSGVETWKPFSSITSCQINQSDLWQTPNRTANFSKLSRSSVWFILPEMEGMFSSHAPHSPCLRSVS